MPVDMVIAPPDDHFWHEMHESEMKLKMRVRRMKEGRDLRGGFTAFSSCFPGLCEGKPTTILPMSLSQPCLPVANVGPTRILPHLYLGSQKDVLNKDLMAQNGITYVLNASNTCPKPDFICESHFMRVPVNDNYCEKLLPWLEKTNDFIDKAKVSNCRVIVHCLAGISRSATIAIAYIMKTMGLSSDDAYRFVKDRRPSISPNFNFLGQLLEFEKGLKLLKALSSVPGKALVEQESGSSGSRMALVESGPSRWEREPQESECRSPCATSLQQDLGGLHLSSERVLEASRLKRTFSLNIKSAYGCGPYPRATPDPALQAATATTEDLPKLCKLDSPGPTNGLCSFVPVPDSPGSPEGDELWTQQRRREMGAHSSPGAPPAPSLSVSVSRGPSLDGTVKASLLLSLPGLTAMGPGQIWTKHSEPTQTGTAGTPTSDRPWCFGADLATGTGCSGSARFGTGPAYVALACAGRVGGLEGVRLRDKPPKQRDSRGSWHEEPPGGAPDKQFKRRSCQMEFEDGMAEVHSACEELGKIAKQSSFSGSVEVIEVS